MSKPVLEELISQLSAKHIKEIRSGLALDTRENDKQSSGKSSLNEVGPIETKDKKFSKTKTDDNKLLLLFNLLTSGKEYSREDMVNKIYSGEISRNAFDNLRKRLIKRVLNHLFADMVTDEEFKVGAVFGMILLAYKLTGQRAASVMLYLLEKAEFNALELRLYNVLDGIYDLQEQHALLLGLDLKKVAEKRAANDVLYDKMRKVKRALTEIQIQANESKRTGTFPPINTIITTALENQKITEEDTDNPAFQIRIMTILRMAYLYSKEYYKLEPIFIQRYNELNERDAFGKGDRDSQLAFLYMIAHVYYRMSKFKLAAEWLDKLNDLLQPSFSANHIYVLKHKALCAAICTVTGKNELAISTLEEALKHRPQSHEMTEWLNMELSLAVYYFEGKHYRRCIKTLHTIAGYDVDLKAIMGKEWCFKMELIGVLAQYESGDPEFALRLIRSMNNNYKEFMTEKQYNNAGIFIHYISEVIKNSDIVRDAKFRKGLREAAEDWEKKQGHDLHAVRFFCWLKSKMHECDYYELLVGELTEKGL